MMKMKKKVMASVLAAMLICASGCGSEGNREMQSKNAVEGAIESQIQKEEAKTAEQPTEAATTATTEIVTEQDPSTEADTKKKFTEATTEKKDMMEEIRESYIDTPDASVDIDLTVMSSDMVYATVSDMVYNSPDDYVGKKIKMRGAYTTASSSATNLTYHYVIIKDATQCCAQGLEFVWGDGSHDLSEYPEDGTEVEVIGVYETYTEPEDPDFLYSRVKDATMKVVVEPTDTAARAD